VFDLLALPDGLEVTLRIALIMVAAVVAFLFVRTAVNVSVPSPARGSSRRPSSSAG
jgi:archaellin